MMDSEPAAGSEQRPRRGLEVDGEDAEREPPRAMAGAEKTMGDETHRPSPEVGPELAEKGQGDEAETVGFGLPGAQQ